MGGPSQGKGPLEREPIPGAHVTVATDEIYEKYLQKAITEINALGDEVAQAGGGARVPVVGSGHPLADVFLLKYAPQRVGAPGGRRVLRPRRQRAPQVAAAAARRPDGDLRDELPEVRGRRRGGVAAVPPARAAHRAAEARRRDGRRDARRVPERRSSSRSRARSPTTEGELQQFTPTIEALVTPDIDDSLDEQPAKTRVLERVQAARHVVGRAASLLSRRRVDGVRRRSPSSSSRGSSSRRTSRTSGSGRRSSIVSLVVMPGTLLLVLVALPLWEPPLVAARRRPSCSRCSRSCFAERGLGARGELREAVGGGLRRLGVPLALRAALVGRARRVRHPGRRRDLRLARADARDHRAPLRRLHRGRDRVRRPAAAARRTSGRRTSSSSRCSSRAAARWELRVSWTWFGMTRMYGLTVVLANAAHVDGLPALPFLSFGFLARERATCSGARLREPRRRRFFRPARASLTADLAEVNGARNDAITASMIPIDDRRTSRRRSRSRRAPSGSRAPKSAKRATGRSRVPRGAPRSPSSRTRPADSRAVQSSAAFDRAGTGAHRSNVFSVPARATTLRAVAPVSPASSVRHRTTRGPHSS